MPSPIDALSSLVQRIADLERRSNNHLRPGKVHSVDPEEGTFVLQYGTDEDGQPVLSPDIPWTEQAGTIKTWSPPTVGEQMLMISPSGEIGAHSWGMKGGFSDANKQPHNKGGEYVMDVKDGAFRIHVDSAGNLNVSGNGKETRTFKTMELKASRIDHTQGGGGSPRGVSTA